MDILRMEGYAHVEGSDRRCEGNAMRIAKPGRPKSFSEQAWLWRHGWFAAGNPDNTEYGHFQESRAWNEDSECRAMQIGRCDLHSAVEQGE